MTTKQKAEYILELPEGDIKLKIYAKDVAYRYLELIRKINNLTYESEKEDGKPEPIEHHPV